ncbi:chemotaxis protein CheB (plasmid) [Deinococcus radiomollis]|uniref:chemotaxis protein CheB n=1 Tax=Deinococcus radiomollis TaxID=468916 RepID=UPI003891F718
MNEPFDPPAATGTAPVRVPVRVTAQTSAQVPLVVIGGSAGALEPLLELVRALPPGFPAAVLVVIHLSPDFPSQLPEILQATTPLPVEQARDHAPLRPGHIYVARADHHLLAGQTHISVSRGPRENRYRPSIDVLFRSAAFTHGSRVIGVLLSGMLDDGTSGLWTIKRLGGHAVIQHPEEAQYPSMPLTAARQIAVDAIVPVREIVGRLQTILGAPGFGREAGAMDNDERRRLELEVGIARQDNAFGGGILNQGDFSAFTCPECHGVLVKLKEGGRLRFRCHTGHAYSAEALLSDLSASVEAGLWNALRALEEEAMLLEHLAKHAAEAELPEQAGRYVQALALATDRMREVRRTIVDVPVPEQAEPGQAEPDRTEPGDTRADDVSLTGDPTP